MTTREKRLKQRLAVLYQQLELYRRFPKEFEKALGKSGIEPWLDSVLDEIIAIQRQLNEADN